MGRFNLRDLLRPSSRDSRKKPRVAFVLCPFWNTETPPLGMSYLSSYLKSKSYETFLFDFNIRLYSRHRNKARQGWEFQMPNEKRDALFNERVFLGSSFWNRELERWLEKILAAGSEVVCFSVYYENLALSHELARRIKEENHSVQIVFGGPHCRKNRSCYQGFDPDVVDAFVVGEGEETLLELVEYYRRTGRFLLCKGSVTKMGFGGHRKPIRDLDSIPFPDFSELPLKKYSRKGTAPILLSRGCTGRCVYCRDRNMWPGFSHRSAQNVIREMKLGIDQGYTHFRFSDLIINGSVKHLESICEFIREEGLEITWEGSLRSNAEMNRAFFKRLNKAGFVGGNLGVESGSQKILNLMKKGHTVKTVEDNLRAAHWAGIGLGINLIVGFPGETESTFQETLSFLARNKNRIPTLSSLTPLYVLPESALYDNHEAYEIRLESDDERDWVCSDRHNTPEWRIQKCTELYEFVKDLGSIHLECDQYRKDVKSNHYGG